VVTEDDHRSALLSGRQRERCIFAPQPGNAIFGLCKGTFRAAHGSAPRNLP
jgi:hypothetical protein